MLSNKIGYSAIRLDARPTVAEYPLFIKKTLA